MSDPYAKAVHCPYTISIDGSRLFGDGSECFESKSGKGVLAQVSATDPRTPQVLEKVLVWDEDAPCGGINGQSYIHYSGVTSDFAGMTAGAGDWMHTYKAAVFADGIPVPQGTVGCYPFTSRGNDAVMPICLETWRVARFGSECPEQPTAPAVVAWAALVSTSLAVAVLVGFLTCRCRRRKRKGHDLGGEGIFTTDDVIVPIEVGETEPALLETVEQPVEEEPVTLDTIGEIKVTATIV